MCPWGCARAAGPQWPWGRGRRELPPPPGRNQFDHGSRNSNLIRPPVKRPHLATVKKTEGYGWGVTSQRASHAPAWPWRAATCSGAAPSGPVASTVPGSALRGRQRYQGGFEFFFRFCRDLRAKVSLSPHSARTTRSAMAMCSCCHVHLLPGRRESLVLK